jgi:hypothetical protein
MTALPAAITGHRALLALLYLHPDKDYSLTEAGALIGASPKVMQTEATRLVTAGLAREERLGRVRLLRAETSGPVSRPLTAAVRPYAAVGTVGRVVLVGGQQCLAFRRRRHGEADNRLPAGLCACHAPRCQGSSRRRALSGGVVESATSGTVGEVAKRVVA